jgi:hypothetical protein
VFIRGSNFATDFEQDLAEESAVRESSYLHVFIVKKSVSIRVHPWFNPMVASTAAGSYNASHGQGYRQFL